jgi:hypothetical protein
MPRAAITGRFGASVPRIFRIARLDHIIRSSSARQAGYWVRLDETRKNAAHWNRIRDDFSRLFGGRGLERRYHNAMRRRAKPYRRRVFLARTEFRASAMQPPFGLAIFNGE